MAKKKKAASRAKKAQPRQERRQPSPYEVVGRDVGALVGFGDLGERVGGAVGKLFGKGDYVLHTNSLIGAYGQPPAGPAPPEFFRSGRRGTRVVEREYIGDIVSGTLSGGSTVFSNTSYSINPADPVTFPWLSQLASQFEQWEPNGIVFEYRSTSSEYNGTSQSLGVVILATDYDALDPQYSSKAEMENADYSMSVKAASSAVHGIECDPRERPTPILICGAGATGSDRRFHDLGTFQVATQGMSAAGVTLGELWVSYDITFYKKQLHGTLARDLISYGSYATAGISTSDYFGSADASFRSWGTMDGSALVTADTVYLPPKALVGSHFLVSMTWAGSSATCVAPTLTYTGCAVASDLPYSAIPYLYSAGVGTHMNRQVLVEVTSEGASIALSSGTLPASATSAGVQVIQVADDWTYQPVA